MFKYSLKNSNLLILGEYIEIYFNFDKLKYQL